MKSETLRRRRKLIKPRFQLRMIASFVGVAALSLVAQAIFLGSKLTELATELPVGGNDLQARLPDLLLLVIVQSLVLLLPLTLGFGVLITFRTAGPIYRFEQYLAQVARGEDVGPCRIREKDELQELCGRINAALEHVRDSSAAGPSAPPSDLPLVREAS